ncbi:hypothetical protein CL622_04440 [archaeon]|nr:hypothetical protein [archaeon]|tara:strand:- start:901 stop:1098 length:198 start_codon:yes stop_codon:yes gene_type:complete
MTIKQTADLQAIDVKIKTVEDILEDLYKQRRAIVNNNDLNKGPSWPDNDRIESIGQNGNTGEHYD